MGGEGPPPAELMAPEGHKREREAEKAVPAIPEQASASRKRPEEEEEEDSVQSQSGPALLALRMRCGLGARGGSWFRYAGGLRKRRGARCG